MELITFRVLEVCAYGILLLCELLGPSHHQFTPALIVLIANMFVAVLTMDAFTARPWTLNWRVLLIAAANLLLAGSYGWYATHAQRSTADEVHRDVVISVAAGLCLLHACYAGLGLSVREWPPWGEALCCGRRQRRQVHWKDPLVVAGEEGRDWAEVHVEKQTLPRSPPRAKRARDRGGQHC